MFDLKSFQAFSVHLLRELVRLLVFLGNGEPLVPEPFHREPREKKRFFPWDNFRKAGLKGDPWEKCLLGR